MSIVLQPVINLTPSGAGAGGAAGQTAFSDTFTRADKSTWGPDWIRTLSNTPGGAGNGITGVASVSSNQGRMTTIGGVNPTQSYQPTWIPIRAYVNIYNLAGAFVQYTFQSNVANGLASVLRYNHDLNNTQTQTEGSDYYVMLFNGRIDKVVGGGAQATIGALTWVAAASDVLRFECLTAGAQVTLQAIRNGAILQTVVDNTATRILTGGPGMQLNSMGASGSISAITNFSCDMLTVLST